MLIIFKQRLETEVHCDASMDGFRIVLLQHSPADNHLHPVYYMSCKTTDAKRKYSNYKLETLAVVEALKKFRVYLLGTKFKILTNCAAFQQTIRKKGPYYTCR